MTFVAGGALVSIVLHLSKVLVIRSLLIVLVTVDTRENLVVSRHIVAGGATGPFAAVGAGVNRKVKRVVFAKLSFFAGWMATKAGCAVEAVALYALVFGIHQVLCVFVTGHTGKHLPLVDIGMTGRACIPGVDVGP